MTFQCITLGNTHSNDVRTLAGPEHPNLTLIGAVVGGNEGIGVFLDQATHGFVRMKTGEDHGGWVLRSIKAREVTLEKGPQSETLRLSARNDAVPPPPPQGSEPE